MQIMAYGGSKPVPFQQAICQSQALEPGIRSNYTIEAFRLVVDAVGCNATALHSAETITCLRGLDTSTIFNASESTYTDEVNVGDIWLPVVDGDFLPEAPSQLLAQGKFANVTAMMGWCEDDMDLFTDDGITSAQDTHDFIQAYAPAMTPANVDALLSLYPSAEFSADPAASKSAEFYRSSRIFRDILMVCEAVYYAEALAAAGNQVYLYDWNQTILDPMLDYLYNESGLGVIHTSEFAYIFGNISHFDTMGYPFDPTPADYGLVSRGSRSWTTFASAGVPGLAGHNTFQGFATAVPAGADGGVNETFSVFVAGGPNEGFSPVDGPDSKPEIAVQKLRERCAFINSAEIIEQLKF